MNGEGVKSMKLLSARTIVVLLGTALQVSAAPAYQLLSECDPSSAVLAQISKDSQITVRFAIAGAATCYSVTANVDGKPIRGYVLDKTLDGVLAFEKTVSQARQNLIEAPAFLPPPAPPVPDAAPSAGKKSPDPAEPAKQAPKPKAKSTVVLN
jgi:hypothetical protein